MAVNKHNLIVNLIRWCWRMLNSLLWRWRPLKPSAVTTECVTNASSPQNNVDCKIIGECRSLHNSTVWMRSAWNTDVFNRKQMQIAIFCQQKGEQQREKRKGVSSVSFAALCCTPLPPLLPLPACALLSRRWQAKAGLPLKNRRRVICFSMQQQAMHRWQKQQARCSSIPLSTTAIRSACILCAHSLSELSLSTARRSLFRSADAHSTLLLSSLPSHVSRSVEERLFPGRAGSVESIPGGGESGLEPRSGGKKSPQVWTQ